MFLSIFPRKAVGLAVGGTLVVVVLVLSDISLAIIVLLSLHLAVYSLIHCKVTTIIPNHQK